MIRLRVDNQLFMISEETIGQYRKSVFYQKVKESLKCDFITKEIVDSKITLYIDADPDMLTIIIKLMRGGTHDFTKMSDSDRQFLIQTLKKLSLDELIPKEEVREPTKEIAVEKSSEGTPKEQPAVQPVAQPVAQSVAQSVAQPTGQTAEQPAVQPTEQSSGQTVEQPTGQPTGQSAEQPVEQPTEQKTGGFRFKNIRNMPPSNITLSTMSSETYNKIGGFMSSNSSNPINIKKNIHDSTMSSTISLSSLTSETDRSYNYSQDHNSKSDVNKSDAKIKQLRAVKPKTISLN